MSEQIALDDIKYDGSIYPREKPSSATIKEYADAIAGGAKFPPIVLEAGTSRLLDGYHRWKAHLQYREGYQPELSENGDGLPEPSNEISCEFHEIPEGITAKLYALYLSSRNGLRPKDGDRETVVQEQYIEHMGCAIGMISKYAGVSRDTVRKYIAPLIAEFKETKRSIILRLDALGWIQEEISAALKAKFPDAKGTSRISVQDFLSEMQESPFLTKTELDKGHEPATLAQRYALPEILVWRAKLKDMSDQKRTEALSIKIQPYDVWNFGKCHDLFGAKHPGRIPGEIVMHVLYFYTKEGDMVVDPMAGSGTTQDVCLAMHRKCYGFDVDDRHERPDIIKHDMLKDGWHPRTKKADLIFWDPPYYKKMDGKLIGEDGYIEESISRLDWQPYRDFFAGRLAEALEIVNRGTRLAFLMSDYDDVGEGIYIWDYIDLIRSAGWELIKHIQAPLPSQQVHGDTVKKFRASKRMARLERYLLIAEKA